MHNFLKCVIITFRYQLDDNFTPTARGNNEFLNLIIKGRIIKLGINAFTNERMDIEGKQLTRKNLVFEFLKDRKGKQRKNRVGCLAEPF